MFIGFDMIGKDCLDFWVRSTSLDSDQIKRVLLQERWWKEG